MNRLENGTPVKILPLTDEQVLALQKDSLTVGWNPDMRRSFGKLGHIVDVCFNGPAGEVSSYGVEVTGMGTWHWPPQYLKEIGDSKEPALFDEEANKEFAAGDAKLQDLSGLAQANEKAKMEYLTNSVKHFERKEARDPADRLAKSDDEAVDMVVGRDRIKGGYDKVLYGRVQGYERKGVEATGTFFVFYKAETVTFKLRNAYSDYADALVRTLLTGHDKKPLSGALGGVILVLDEDNNVMMVRNEL